jgi:hypothetical protein
VTRPIRILDSAWQVQRDIDPEARIDSKVLDSLVLTTVAASTTLLSRETSGLDDLQRKHLSDVFDSLKHTHFTIRNLLPEGHDKPQSVDALPLARLQLEALFSLCLILEQPEFLGICIKNGWKRIYKSYLLQRAEVGALPRFREYLFVLAPKWLEYMQRIASVSDGEKQTIEIEELGQTPPAGFALQPIKPFPLPRAIIGKIQTPTRKRMLERLYFEYAYLSSFVHGSPDSAMFKSVFYDRSPYRNVLDPRQVKDLFQREIAERAVYMSTLSAVQCATELAAAHQDDVDLRVATIKAWEVLERSITIGRIVWELRAQDVLGILGKC